MLMLFCKWVLNLLNLFHSCSQIQIKCDKIIIQKIFLFYTHVNTYLKYDKIGNFIFNLQQVFNFKII